MAPSTDLKAFKETLRASKNIIVIAGAGLSAASGVPTFRGTGGLWRKYNAMEIATPDAFYESPSLVWQFYHYRREAALKANPNNAHRVLAAFSLPSFRNQIVPGSNFAFITQNVDGLSPRAHKELLATLPPGTNETPSFFEMHGRLFDVLCSDEECGHVEFNTASPICEALAGTEKLVEYGILDPVVEEEILPRCPKCGNLARPGVVWFGEVPQRMDEIDKLVHLADLCLVVGTSSLVQPAAGFARKVKKHGGKVAVFNMEHTRGDDGADFIFLGPCEDYLQKALGLSVGEDGKVSVLPDDQTTNQ